MCLLFYIDSFLQKAGIELFGVGYLKNIFFGIWQGSRFIFYPSKIILSIVQVSRGNSAKNIRLKAVGPKKPI